MATHDYVLDNATGANFRSDLNNALAAIVSNNSSSSQPTTRYAYMWWADTTTGILKIRNSANDGWVTLLQLDGTLTLEDGSNSAPALGFRDDLNTGIFSSAADTLDITCGGTTRGSFSSSGLTVTGNVTATSFVGNIDAVDGDFDGTLEADAITVAGVALSTVIAGTTVTTATNANHVSVADNESTNENNLIPFIEDASATGNVGLESDGDFTYNPSTGLVTATAFSGSGASLTALNIVTDTSPQLGGDLQTNGNNIDFGDSGGASDDRAVFGADTDMQLYHTGSQGVLDNDTGALDINTTSDLRLNVQSIFKVLTKGGSENCIIGNTDGAVELYFDDSKKLETTSEGVLIGNGGLHLGDNNKIEIGNNDDFQIFHDGTENQILAANGPLHTYSGANTELRKGNSSTNEVMLKAIPDGAVELYHNNGKKFSTESYGVSLHGLTQTTQSNILYYNASTGQVSYQAAASGGGKILQVVTAKTNNRTETTSTSFVDTNISASITPASSSNKIIVILSTTVSIDSSNGFIRLTVFRGGSSGTNLGDGNTGISQFGINNGNDAIGNGGFVIVDTPSTTSATTYLVRFRKDGNGTVKVPANNGEEEAVITLMEVSA